MSIVTICLLVTNFKKKHLLLTLPTQLFSYINKHNISYSNNICVIKHQLKKIKI